MKKKLKPLYIYNLEEDIYVIRGFMDKKNKISITINRISKWYYIKDPNISQIIRYIKVVIKNLELLKKQIKNQLPKSIEIEDFDHKHYKNDIYYKSNNTIKIQLKKTASELKNDNNIDKTIRNLKLIIYNLNI